MNQNQKITEQIKQELADLDLKDQVEILANVIMFIGVTHMGDTEPITVQNIAEVVLKDRQSNGETVANALALQGLTMMLWLQNE